MKFSYVGLFIDKYILYNSIFIQRKGTVKEIIYF